MNVRERIGRTTGLAGVAALLAGLLLRMVRFERSDLSVGLLVATVISYRADALRRAAVRDRGK